MTGLLAACWLALGCPPQQQPVVIVSAVPEYVALAPGARQRIAVRLRIPAGWHIGWTNPGGTALPSTLAWRTPAGIGAGTTLWPAPDRDSTTDGTVLVLRGDVTIVTPVRVGPAAARGVAELVGTLHWGLCSDVCIPQERTVSVSFEVKHTGQAERSPAWPVKS